MSKPVAKIANLSIESGVFLLFLDAKILPVDMLYYKSISILMHDNNCKTAPPNLLNLFTRVDSVYSFNTRSASASNALEREISVKNLQFSSYGHDFWTF